MGVWGTGPFDNDSAADLVASMTRRIEPALSDRDPVDARYHYDEARAAAQFVVLAHGTDILGGPDIEKAVWLLARMRSDQEWIASFRDPRKVASALDKEILAVIGKMHACKGCRRRFSKAEWKALEARVADARGAPIPKPQPRPTRVRVTRAKLRRKPKRAK